MKNQGEELTDKERAKILISAFTHLLPNSFKKRKIARQGLELSMKESSLPENQTPERERYYVSSINFFGQALKNSERELSILEDYILEANQGYLSATRLNEMLDDLFKTNFAESIPEFYGSSSSNLIN